MLTATGPLPSASETCGGRRGRAPAAEGPGPLGRSHGRDQPGHSPVSDPSPPQATPTASYRPSPSLSPPRPPNPPLALGRARPTPHPFPSRDPPFPPPPLAPPPSSRSQPRPRPRRSGDLPLPSHISSLPRACLCPSQEPPQATPPASDPSPPRPLWPCFTSTYHGAPRPRPRLLARLLPCPICGLAPVLGPAHLWSRPCPRPSQ